MPLQLMIIIMVATLGTAIIIGWMGNIEEPQSISKVTFDGDRIDLTGSGSGPLYTTSDVLVISVFDQNGDPISDATVVLTGLGITDKDGRTVCGSTDSNGNVTFSDLKLRITGHVGYIDVEVSKSGYGENSSCRITVVA